MQKLSNSKGKVRVQVTIKKSNYDLLKEISKKTHISISDLIDKGLESKYRNHKERIKNDFKMHRVEAARLADEWKRLFPEEDMFGN